MALSRESLGETSDARPGVDRAGPVAQAPREERIEGRVRRGRQRRLLQVDSIGARVGADHGRQEPSRQAKLREATRDPAQERPRDGRHRDSLQGRDRAAHARHRIRSAPARRVAGRTSRGRPACDARLPRLRGRRGAPWTPASEGGTWRKQKQTKQAGATPSRRATRAAARPVRRRSRRGRGSPRQGGERAAATVPGAGPRACRRARPRSFGAGVGEGAARHRRVDGPRSSARSRSPSSSPRTATCSASTTPRRRCSPPSRKPSTTRSTPARRPASCPSCTSRSTTSASRP